VAAPAGAATLAPRAPFLWNDGGKLTKGRLREEAGTEARASVAVVSLDSLLATVPSEDRAKFNKLAEAVKQQLSGVKVYKVGDEPEKAVYVVGKTADGKWAGLKTSVVET